MITTKTRITTGKINCPVVRAGSGVLVAGTFLVRAAGSTGPGGTTRVWCTVPDSVVVISCKSDHSKKAMAPLITKNPTDPCKPARPTKRPVSTGPAAKPTLPPTENQDIPEALRGPLAKRAYLEPS